MTAGFNFFDTPIGRCGVAWGQRGLLAVQLPEADDGKTRARVLRRIPHAPMSLIPSDIQAACDAMSSLLRGESIDLSFIALDMDDVPSFNRSVYDIARTIPAGETLTYGDIAKRLGDVRLSREVGHALGKNPFTIVVPCHRVLAAKSRPGGFSAGGGVTTKFKMLTIERAQIPGSSEAADQPLLFDPGLSIAPSRQRS